MTRQCPIVELNFQEGMQQRPGLCGRTIQDVLIQTLGIYENNRLNSLDVDEYLYIDASDDAVSSLRTL
jgi:hypothetical protein